MFILLAIVLYCICIKFRKQEEEIKLSHRALQTSSPLKESSNNMLVSNIVGGGDMDR